MTVVGTMRGRERRRDTRGGGGEVTNTLCRAGLHECCGEDVWLSMLGAFEAFV